MSTIDDHRNQTDSSRERRLFELLNAYVESARSENASADDLDPPPELLQAFPNLGDLLDCLDLLESFGPTAPAGSVDATVCAPSGSVDESHPEKPGEFEGDDFGPYKLLDEIGRGGMGVVYRARHKALGAVVAIKMIRSSRLASAEEVQRFYQEARAAAGLSHPHIIKVHDVGEIGGQHYLAMDLVDGPTLADLLQDGAVDPERAAELIADVARAVEYLHTRGILHRDLKPANVLLDDAGEPHVTDFGLAKLLAVDSHQTATGTIIGTPSYMAPEQAGGRTDDVSVRSDVYSLGAILYELLTGRAVFKEEHALDTLLCVLEREPVLPRKLNSRIPEALELICLRCLEKNPERRYASAGELADDLELFLRGEPIHVPARGPLQRFSKWLAREPALASRLCALAVVVPIVQINYFVTPVSDAEHWPVMFILAAWAVVSWALQRMLNREVLSAWVPFVWALADAALLGLLIYLADGPVEILYAAFPLLIAASGLWFRVRLVSFMTAVCLAAFWLLRALRPSPDFPMHYPGIFSVILLVTGTVVGFQVYRVRRLSRYFERRGPQRSGTTHRSAG